MEVHCDAISVSEKQISSDAQTVIYQQYNDPAKAVWIFANKIAWVSAGSSHLQIGFVIVVVGQVPVQTTFRRSVNVVGDLQHCIGRKLERRRGRHV